MGTYEITRLVHLTRRCDTQGPHGRCVYDAMWRVTPMHHDFPLPVFACGHHLDSTIADDLEKS